MRFALTLIALLLCPAVQAEMLRAPNFEASAADQLDHSKQACGPACLLNQLRFGDGQMQAAETRIPAEGDTRKLRWIIGRYGMKPSAHIGAQRRWNAATGVNVADLQDMANLMAKELRSPRVTTQHLNRPKGDRGQKLIGNTHRLISKSLSKGVPPILQVRRYVNRLSPHAGRRIWMGVHGHFVVIIGVQKDLAKGADSIAVEYADPWRGRKLRGHLRIPKQRFLANNPDAENASSYQVTPYLVVDFPQSSIGTSKVKKGETSQLTCPNLIGRF